MTHKRPKTLDSTPPCHLRVNRKQHRNPQTAPSRDHNSTHNKHTHLTLNRQVHSFKSLQQGTNLRTGRGTNPRTGRSAPQPTHNRQHTAHSTQHTAPTQRHATHSTQHNTQLYFQEQPPMGEASTNWVVEVHGGSQKGGACPLLAQLRLSISCQGCRPENCLGFPTLL